MNNQSINEERSFFKQNGKPCVNSPVVARSYCRKYLTLRERGKCVSIPAQVPSTEVRGKEEKKLKDLSILIKGAGEMASGVAWRLYRAGFHNIILLETNNPMAVRRRVCFCEAVYDGTKMVDGVEGVLADSDAAIDAALKKGQLPVVVDPEWKTIQRRKPQVVIDAIIAKRNVGTRADEAEFVIALGPGFEAGNDKDAHAVIETNRGPCCGRVMYSGTAQKNTGVPGKVMGFDVERVIRAPESGIFVAQKQIDDQVVAGETVAMVAGKPVTVMISGVLRGLIRDGTPVCKGVKVGDIEPRPDVDNGLCSDKSLGLGGAVLEALMTRYNT